MTKPPSPRLRLRGDLIHRQVLMGRESFWVLKDPLSRAIYYFSDREFALLQLLDGQRSLAEITAECASRFAPDYVSSDALVNFLADARRKGLLEGHPALAGQSDPAVPQRRWWQQPLAIRFSGINPDRLLIAMEPWFAGLFTPLAAIVAALILVTSLICVLTHFDALAAHLETAATRGSGLIVLAVVISATKVVHELAHALVCKRFGGECREIGVMLLVGVPCLYCDVSDAWMLRQRWKRIAISLAGMAAELVVASIATWLWLFTADGLVRDLCVTVMVVCSVNTVLFNGNPLLRYDGYFILSDLVGIPNLAAESTGLIRQRLRQFLWGRPAYLGTFAAVPSLRRQGFLIGYGLASTVYRIVMYGWIVLMLYRIAESYEMENLVGGLALVAAITLAVQAAKRILRPPVLPLGRKVALQRPVWIAGLALATVLLGSCLPLPHKIVAPMSIRAADAKRVFVSIPGQLIEMIDEGDQVVAGETIATLANPDVQREQLEQQVALRNLQTELDGLRGSRVSDPQAASRMSVLSEAIDVTQQRLRNREAESERLKLRAPVDGTIFAPPQKPPASFGRYETRTWSETPLSAPNRGAWLQEGTVLCQVAGDEARDALVLVRQQDIQLVRIGQQVSFLLSDHRRGELRGRVMQVGTSPIEAVPAELSVTGLIPPTPPGQEPTYYQVRVAMQGHPRALPIRTTGRVRIHVDPASLATRIGRFLGESFL